MKLTINTASYIAVDSPEGKALIALVENLKDLTKKPEDYLDLIESITAEES